MPTHQSSRASNNLATTPKPRLFMRRWLPVLLISAGAVYYFYTAASAPGPDQNQAAAKPANLPVSVAVATTRLGDMPIYLHGLGTVTALRTVTVHSRVDGELIKVAFTEGQSVRPGDLLAEIDPRPYQVQLKQAEGQLIRDQALLKNAELDMQRYQTLLEQDSISAQQTATQAALVKQYQGTVEMDQGLVDNAKLQLSFTRITSPINGRVGLRLVDQGNMVHASDSNGLLVITQTQPIAVVFTLPEDAVPAIMQRWRKDADISVDAYDRAGSRQLTAGKVSAIDNQIDTTTGTLKLKAQFDNNDHKLFANQFVNIKMHLDTLNAVTLAASAAIQRGADGAFVYVVKADNSIAVQAVKIGATDGETVAVLEGLAAAEKLVVDGADKLRAGSRVNIVKEDGKLLSPPSPASSLPAESTPAHRP